MSKRGHPIETRQFSLFDLIRDTKSNQHQERLEGSMKCIDVLQGALRTAIRSSSLSRYQIAGQMSHLLGTNITKEQIDSWTRKSDTPDSPRRHIPAEYLPAFCVATGSFAPIEVLGRAAGVFVMSGEDALRSEVAKIDEQIKSLQAERKRRAMFLREIR